MSFRGPSYEAMQDDELVELFQQSRENGIFDVLYKRHVKAIYSVCYAFWSGRHAVAEDDTQITFAHAFERIDQYRKQYRQQDGRANGGVEREQKFLAWLRSIARHTCVDRLRREQRERWTSLTPKGEEAPLQPPDPRPDPYQEQRVKELYEYIERLPADQANCLRLDLRGSSYKEIADELGFTPAYVKSCLQNGRRSLEIQMKKKKTA